MKIKLLKSKIHRATVTEANLDYVGSISIDEHLMKEANLYEFEKVHVLNVTNGSRLETYVIKSPAHSKAVCINGAAAHLVKAGDLVIVVSYCQVKAIDAPSHNPKIVHVNQNNEIID